MMVAVNNDSLDTNEVHESMQHMKQPVDPAHDTLDTGEVHESIQHLKPPVDPASISWRQLRGDAFWQQIPAWKDVDEATFLDHRWQEKNAISRPRKLLQAIQDLASIEFMDDVREGFARAPMAVRISPYLLSLIN